MDMEINFLNPSELSKRVYLEYEGKNFNGYKFKINNSPTIRVSKGKQNRILSCTCKLHSIKELTQNCRFTIALGIYLIR